MASKNKGPSAFLRKVDELEAGTTKNVVGKSTVTPSYSRYGVARRS